MPAEVLGGGGISDPALLRIRIEVDALRRADAAFGVAEWAPREGGEPTAMVIIAATAGAAAALKRALERELELTAGLAEVAHGG